MKQILYKLFEHQYLGRDEARTILQNIAQGKYNDAQVASLITVFLMRNISVEELCGFRDALLEMRVPVDLSEFAPIDIVGTGGDGKNTFNISTAACFTVAGAGFPVVKHGNYGAGVTPEQGFLAAYCQVLKVYYEENIICLLGKYLP